MTYELAKELKDAGFPQHLDGNKQMNGDPMRFHAEPCVGEHETCIYIPTLSELIEVCGNDFRSITVTLLPLKAWHCTGVNASATEVLATFHGLTPEEAVARLWLALNKK